MDSTTNRIFLKTIVSTFIFLMLINILVLDWKLFGQKVASQDQSTATATKETGIWPDQTKTSTQKESDNSQIIEVCGANCIKTIEASTSALSKRIDELSPKTTTPTPTTISTNPKVSYIPLGISGASTQNTSWETISSQAIYLSGDDFPGYKNMTLEGYLKVKDGNGKAFARLFNTNDGTALLGSEMESSTWDYSLVESNQFGIASGKKLYKLQLKSLTGYEASVGTVRIRVNF
ncbi:hypothetical protein A2Z23_01120 [Candidatus Curtissbacteria bacterium RBG_16_39_7]|uniref:Uncharacterized protein n=1 Tax=Candidatus Curtissbacteria bacterium RBG_16_39_7 TaxID=1797707 RepID=A0A1F5G410_9BACT|nr:MAG: hypothetical protein A2Z23_01120 [Candidatus Curtissbacteria bacterium RBG_16_39_7]